MDAQLALFIYVSVVAIHRSVADLPGVTPLKQIDSPPPRHHQLSIAVSWAHEPISLPLRMLMDLILYRFCAGNHSCCELLRSCRVSL